MLFLCSRDFVRVWGEGLKKPERQGPCSIDLPISMCIKKNKTYRRVDKKKQTGTWSIKDDELTEIYDY